MLPAASAEEISRPMICKQCHSKEIDRSRRKGLRDRLGMLIGLWPYRCHSCAFRFYSVERKFGRQKVEAPQAKTTKQNRSGPEMAFRTHGEKPTAAIVVEAESHEQLQQLLTALNGALRSYQQAPKSAEHARRG